MIDEPPPEWRALRDICLELSDAGHPLYSALHSYGIDNAISNAVCSGEVPLRGRLLWKHSGSHEKGAFDRIETRLGHTVGITVGIIVMSNLVYYKKHDSDSKTYLDVEGDRPPIVRWLCNNAVPADFGLDECHRFLMTLPGHPRLTKKTAREKFIAAHGDIGPCAFDRAWDKAAHPSWRWPGRPRGK